MAWLGPFLGYAGGWDGDRALGEYSPVTASC